MSARSKQLSLLLIAQLGCVAMGLWMHHRFINKSVARTAQLEAWSRMEDAANDLLSSAPAQTFSLPTTGAPVGNDAFTWVDANKPRAGDVLITDAQWRVLHSPHRAQQDQALAVPGERIVWTPAGESSTPASSTVHGTLELRDGEHLAVARPLGSGEAYLVVHVPVAEVEATAATLFESMPAIGVMTLIWTCALMSVAVYIILSRFQEATDRSKKRSAADALRQAQNLIRTRDAVIFGLAKLADSRDPETGDHLERISVYCTTLASALQRDTETSHPVTPGLIRLIGISSALHDIGKVGIEDRILLKRGPLTEAERRRMQSHTTIGEDCLRKIERRLGSSNFLHMAREIAVAHHEWWDGSGYPHGLSGEAIPLAARIAAVADVYDALSSNRVYKPAYPHGKCVEIIRSQSGKQFDPGIVTAWLTVENKFREIARQHGSSAPESLPSSADYATSEGELEVETVTEPQVAHSVGGGR